MCMLTKYAKQIQVFQLISRMGSCYVGSQEKCEVMAVAVAGDGEKDYENDEN